MILKSYQKFRSKTQNVLNEKINKIAFIADNDKRMKPINSIEIYAYGEKKKYCITKNKWNVWK